MTALILVFSLSFIYFPDFTLLSLGFFVSSGIAQDLPNLVTPSIRPSAHKVLILLSEMPHFSDASDNVI